MLRSSGVARNLSQGVRNSVSVIVCDCHLLCLENGWKEKTRMQYSTNTGKQMVT